ncbi:MAG TPA: type II toxin-antitoxin system death-on-curing family toxin [Candidatus Eisenbacteria bacterium]|nr:type II toxin-antitoxin system death-on-curing family toxin [Candidatus Eisenbacteria bacterium]
MKQPRWINRRALHYLHEASLAAHGGASGIRDEGLLESALACPRNRFLHDETADLAALAASYCFGLATNHPFVDGNERTAFQSLGILLGLNGFEMIANQVEAIVTILSLASGELTEVQLADWVRNNSRSRA